MAMNAKVATRIAVRLKPDTTYRGVWSVGVWYGVGV
jgi:hypothetical protein